MSEHVGGDRSGRSAADAADEAIPAVGNGTEGPRDAAAPQGMTPDGEPRRLDPRVRSYWWLRGAVSSVLLVAAAVAADFGILVPRLVPDSWPVGAASGAVALVSIGWSVFAPVVAYERWRFALRERDLWIRRGIVVRSVSIVPYRRLQFVDTEQGPLARLFGLAELVVHTAAPGTSGRVPGLDAREAERLRERLAHLEPDRDEPI